MPKKKKAVSSEKPGKEKKETAKKTEEKEEPAFLKGINERMAAYEAGTNQASEQIASLAKAVQGIATTYANQLQETNTKIVALSEAVTTLNNEFTGFVKSLKSQFNPAPPANPTNPTKQAPPSHEAVKIEEAAGAKTPAQSPAPANPNPPAESAPPSIGDKALGWANILAQLAGSQPSGPPSSSTEEGLVKGFQMMMTVMTGMGSVMATMRKGFMDEVKNSVDMVKMLTAGGSAKGSESQPHLKE